MAPKLCAGAGAIAWVIVEVCAPKHTQTRTINQLCEEQQSWRGVFWLRNRTRSFGDANGFFSKPYVFPRKVIYQTGTISSSRHFLRSRRGFMPAMVPSLGWCRSSFIQVYPYANNQPAGSRATNWRGVFWLRKIRKRSAGETNIGWALPALWRTGSNYAVPEERSDRKGKEFH